MRRRRPAAPLSPRALARLHGGGPVAGGEPEPVATHTPDVVGQFVPGPADLVVDVRSSSASGRHRRVRPPRSRWAQLPAALVGARWQPGRAAVAGVAAVTVLAVLVLGLRVAWARSADDVTVIAPGGGARAGPTGVASAAAPVGLPPVGAPGVAGAEPSPSGAAARRAQVVVHVVGEVEDPGVRRLDAGARVSDAVAAAGGATPEADLGAVNLARVLVDGEQVRVPRPGEAPAPVPRAATGGALPGAATDSPVRLNDADLAALDTLPGVGPVLAQRILDWRTAHGRFTSVDELAEVSGIGEKLLARLRPLVTT